MKKAPSISLRPVCHRHTSAPHTHEKQINTRDATQDTVSEPSLNLTQPVVKCLPTLQLPPPPETVHSREARGLG